MNVRPLKNNVVVERIPAEKATTSGIILKTTDGPDKAKVIAIGPDVADVAIGDVLLINWNLAKKFDGELFVVPEDEVIFVYED